ncbi:glycosyltransferase family 39 protein [Chloroflexi bacterium TSY]|nr:glycosyltransferase family 39 protein [Chloroflexi bacterium TSY]
MNLETRATIDEAAGRRSNQSGQLRILLGQLINSKLLLFTMILLQVLWFIGIWATGASTSGVSILFHILYTIVCGLIIWMLPETWFIKFKRVKERLIQNPRTMLTTTIIIVLCVGALYSYYQRVWTWDEENSFKAAKLLAEEGPAQFFANYSSNGWLGRFHPPLMPLIYGFSTRIFGVSLLVMRLAAVMLALGTVLCTYFLGRRLYDNEIGVLAAFLLLTFPLIIRQGAAAMTDMGVTFFFTLAMLLTLYLYHQATYRKAILLGIVIGLGLLTKYTMLLIGPVLLGYYLLHSRFRKLTPHFIVGALISFTLLGGWLAYAYQIGVLSGQQTNLVTEFEPAYFFVNSEGHGWLLESILTKLPSSIGMYNLPLLFIGIVLIIQHRRFSDQFLLLWIFVLALELLLTLPDHRYFMPIFPALAVVGANGIKNVPKVSDRLVLLAILFAVSSLVLFATWFRSSGLFNECFTSFC